MLPIVVLTERGERHVEPTVEELGALVRRIGDAQDRFLVVQRAPDQPSVFIQIWHEADRDYALEYRDGALSAHLRTRLDAPEPVAAAMVGWANADQGWAGAFEWEVLGSGDADRPAELELSGDDCEQDDCEQDDYEQLVERVQLSIAGGYATRAEVIELAEDYLVSGEDRPVSREQAVALVDQLWLERLREQETWRGETDPERLTRAFSALEDAGIVAREDFACCSTCGRSEIKAEASEGAVGFVFFHGQCTDRAAAGGALMLYYGGFDDSQDTTACVARHVVAELEQVGLSVEWSGDTARAIEVTPLDWRRRLVA
jgi:hypothetical protein